MPQNRVNATLILRNDLAATWATRNPVLARGEIGAEIDTGLLKLGDGVTAFNSLEYINDNSHIDENLITKVDGNLTVANFGGSYWRYDDNNLEEVEVIEPDLTKWPSYLELEVKNGAARWVQPKAIFNKIEGKIDGALITLARSPLYNNEAATKSYVDATITTSINNANHLKREIVNTLPVSPADNVIYMIKDVNATGADQYKEYILINGTLTQIGDTSVDLTNYIQKVSNPTAGNLASVAADGSLIDSGIPATDVNRLEVATSSRLGGVLASSANNYINVDMIGQMYLNGVSTDLLFNGNNEFVLNGGGA